VLDRPRLARAWRENLDALDRSSHTSVMETPILTIDCHICVIDNHTRVLLHHTDEIHNLTCRNKYHTSVIMFAHYSPARSSIASDSRFFG
jgi:hypothetical protein